MDAILGHDLNVNKSISFASKIQRAALAAARFGGHGLQVVLDAVENIVTGGYLPSSPSTVAEAQTAVLAVIAELSSDPKVNSMAEALLSDAKDFLSNGVLNSDTADQYSASSNDGFLPVTPHSRSAADARKARDPRPARVRRSPARAALLPAPGANHSSGAPSAGCCLL